MLLSRRKWMINKRIPNVWTFFLYWQPRLFKKKMQTHECLKCSFHKFTRECNLAHNNLNCGINSSFILYCDIQYISYGIGYLHGIWDARFSGYKTEWIGKVWDLYATKPMTIFGMTKELYFKKYFINTWAGYWDWTLPKLHSTSTSTYQQHTHYDLYLWMRALLYVFVASKAK